MVLALARAEAAPRVSGVELSENAWAELYDAHFDFVWRSLRRLGVPLSVLDDAAQEVFLVALRRHAEFEGRSALKTWLFGIAWNIARSLARSPVRREEALPDAVASDELGPAEAAARSEAIRALYELLDELESERRAVFVMAELEELSAPEIAEITGTPINTVYSRLRAARVDFDAALRRRRARDDWRGR
jgi:RNA polymerase sigma-70 factor (ECF subfamily)